MVERSYVPWEASHGTYDLSTKVYEVFGTLDKTWGETQMVITGGYSYNQINSNGMYVGLGDFPDNSLDYSDASE